MIKILAIDDNPDNLISIKALISEAFPNAQIFTALSGEIGLELAVAEEPDVILLDIVMPVMDGFEVCKKLKTDLKLSDIPVVFVTAIKGDKESRIKALECGAEAFLAKPIDESELTAQIRAMVKIKNANTDKRDETKRLAILVAERTEQLEQELIERKRAIEALIESEERFKHVFESANVGKSITLPTGEINVNKAFCDMLGYTNEELKNKKWQDITPPEDIENTQKHIDTLILGEKSETRFNKRFIHKNGMLIWADVNSALKRDRQGNPMHLITTIIDITERKQTEELLQNSEEKYRVLFEQASDGIFISDKQGNYIDVNQSGCDMVGYSRDEILKFNITDIVTPKSISQLALKLDQISEGIILYSEREMIRKDGVLIQVEISAKMLPNGRFQGIVRDITMRKIAEKRLMESEMRSRSTFDQSPVGSVIVGLDKRFIKCNSAFCKFLGYSEKELIGKTISEITYPVDIEIGMLDLKLMVEGKKEIATVQKRYVKKDGTIVWGEVSISLGRDENNKPMYFLPIIQDINERVKAEVALRKSEEKYRNIFENVQDVFYQVDLDGNIIDISPSIQYFSGFSRDELIGFPVSTLYFNPNDRVDVLNELMKDNEFRDFENKFRTKTGGIRHVSINARLVIGTNGKPSHIDGAIRDITERKLAENELRKLSRALEQSPDSILITNTQGEIEYVNPALQKLSGYSAEELIGRNPRIFKSGETPIEIYKKLWDTITSGLVWEGELQNKNKNGELFWESATISPVTDSFGKTTHYLAIRKDITDQKRMTQELIAAKEKAEESDKLKTSFLANMSHEIRTPMNSIMGFASLLPEEESKELMANYTNIIIRNSEQLLHIIDDIVIYSSLQTKLFSFHPNKFSLQSMLDEIKQSFNLPEFHKGVELKIETDTKEHILINSDYEKLRQVFTNLISNAYKYTPKGTISIGFLNEGEKLIFFVKDTGIGISSNEFEKVFERFYRGMNVNKSAIGGTGLGLSIVKELIELMDGKIWIESKEGKGSTFYFTLNMKG